MFMSALWDCKKKKTNKKKTHKQQQHSKIWNLIPGSGLNGPWSSVCNGWIMLMDTGGKAGGAGHGDKRWVMQVDTSSEVSHQVDEGGFPNQIVRGRLISESSSIRGLWISHSGQGWGCVDLCIETWGSAFGLTNYNGVAYFSSNYKPQPHRKCLFQRNLTYVSGETMPKFCPGNGIVD